MFLSGIYFIMIYSFLIENYYTIFTLFLWWLNRDFCVLYIDGQLRKLHEGKITEEKFEFNVNNDPELNQKHYEELGEVIKLKWQVKIIMFVE